MTTASASPTKINFTPWVGENYGKALYDKRILILGLSHYRWDPEMDLWPELTQHCIKRQLEGHKQAFWTRITKAFLGTSPSLEDKHTFWHAVAFYNFVQFEVGFGPKVAPTPEMWERSVPDFEATLARLQPQLLVVLGYSLWNHLPDLDGHYEASIRDQKHQDAWRYPLADGKSCLAFRVRHPSSGFDALAWHPHIQEAIRRA